MPNMIRILWIFFFSVLLFWWREGEKTSEKESFETTENEKKHGPCLSQKKLNSFPIFFLGCLSFCSHIIQHVCWPHPKIIHHPTNIVVLLKETKKKNHFFVSGTTKRNDQNEIYMCFIGQLILCVCVCCPNWLCCCCCHSFFWLFQIGHHHHYHQKKKNVWKKRRITIWWLASINLRIKILMMMMVISMIIGHHQSNDWSSISKL